MELDLTPFIQFKDLIQLPKRLLPQARAGKTNAANSTNFMVETLLAAQIEVDKQKYGSSIAQETETETLKHFPIFLFLYNVRSPIRKASA